MEAAAPVLLLFLSAACLGCHDLWEGLGQLQTDLGDAARLVVVTRSPGSGPTRGTPTDHGSTCEDAAAVAALAAGAPPASAS